MAALFRICWDFLTVARILFLGLAQKKSTPSCRVYASGGGILARRHTNKTGAAHKEDTIFKQCGELHTNQLPSTWRFEFVVWLFGGKWGVPPHVASSTARIEHNEPPNQTTRVAQLLAVNLPATITLGLRCGAMTFLVARITRMEFVPCKQCAMEKKRRQRLQQTLEKIVPPENEETGSTWTSKSQIQQGFYQAPLFNANLPLQAVDVLRIASLQQTLVLQLLDETVGEGWRHMVSTKLPHHGKEDPRVRMQKFPGENGLRRADIGALPQLVVEAALGTEIGQIRGDGDASTGHDNDFLQRAHSEIR